MKMTIEIAAAIQEWASLHITMVSLGENQGTGRLLPRSGTKLRYYILGRCKDHELVLTSQGVAVVRAAVLSLESEARAVIDEQKASEPEKSEDFAGVKQVLEQKPTPPAATVTAAMIPADGVLWVLCNAAEAKRRLDDQGKKSLERKTVLEQLVAAPLRKLPHTGPEHIQAVQQLRLRHPNFEPAIAPIVRHLQLLELGRSALRLPPILLAGPPGVGKTHFARSLAQALSMPLRIQSLADASAGWLFTGLHSNWADASPGIITRVVAACPQGQAPLLLIDELDKAGGERRFPADLALLGLLEPGTAQVFRDENLDLELDARPVSYLLTANRLHTIRPELRSRLQIVEILPPAPEQMPAVVRSVDAALRQEHPELDAAFEPLEEKLIEALGARPPRDLRRLLLDGYASAVAREAGRREGLQLRLEDLGLRAPAPEPPPGRYVISLLIPSSLHGPSRVQ